MSKCPETSVYFIENMLTGGMKIGSSGNVDKRIRSLQSGSDGELRIALEYFGWGVKEEKLIHKAAKDSLIRGEWFRQTHFVLGLLAVANRASNECLHCCLPCPHGRLCVPCVVKAARDTAYRDELFATWPDRDKELADRLELYAVA